MNYYKKICTTALCALCTLMPSASLSSCTSGSAEDADSLNFPGVMTVANFASLTKSFQLFSAGSLFIVPKTLMTPKDQITNRVEVFAHLVPETIEGDGDPVQVQCVYYTFGNATPDAPPTGGLMEITFASPAGQNNDGVIHALGLREVGVGNALSGLVLTFNFQANEVNVSASGSSGSVVQPGDGGTGEDTNYEEEIYGLTFAVRASNL